ncbi:MAG: ammonia-forming cytochrome c nitrite reductase subunit c552 [Archaeoglobaceae archaeon]
MKIGIVLAYSMLLFGLALFILCTAPERSVEFKTAYYQIPEGELDPAAWAKAYPLHYERFMLNSKPSPANKSKYQKGWDEDLIVYDKLSEFPYLALLYHGWGFGIEYNVPRGHYYRVKDQIEVDKSRLAPGGVCLSCKSPYAPKLEKEYGLAYYRTPYFEALAWIPEEHRELGDSCADCHRADGSLKISRDFSLGKALRQMGYDPENLPTSLMRSLVCAQCHVTYIIPRDEKMKPVGLFLSWNLSKSLDDISVEKIIAVIRSNASYNEWTQKVTGFKLGFIRHPEFELYARNSTHWLAGVACADCHMGYVKIGGYKITDHWITSPLKKDLRTCKQCHTQSEEWLKQRVFEIQDRTISLLIRSGYTLAETAKLFEIANKAKSEGVEIDEKAYEIAKELYIEAFYRHVFIQAENSYGFHNPEEAMRILGDAIAMASEAKAILKTALQKAGVDVPATIDLELEKYLNNRGEKMLKFKPEQEFRDPFGTQEKIVSIKHMR